MIKVVVMAGGLGIRLWPLSRARHPKQFLVLNDEYDIIRFKDNYGRVTG